MKKILVLFACLLMLVGCSDDNHTAKYNDDTVIYQIGDKKFTNNDLYNIVSNYDYSSIIEDELLISLGKAEGIDTEQFNEGAEEYVTTLMFYSSYYGVDYLSSYGGEENAKRAYIATSCQTELTRNYVKADFDSYVEDHSPVLAQYAYFEDEESAKNVIEMVNNGSTFEMASADNGYTETLDNGVFVKSDNSVPSEVKEAIFNGNLGISSVILSVKTITDTDGNETQTPYYYVVNIVSKNVEDFEDKFIERIVGGDFLDLTEITNYYISLHDVHFYDQNAYDYMSSKYELGE